jgi:DNA polymerase I
MRPATPEAYRLLHEGALALADVERNGIKIDTDYLDRAIAKAEKQIAELQVELEQDKVARLWRKTYGDRTNFDSGKQLADILFNKLGLECKHWTGKQEPKTDEASLEDVDLPFVKKHFKQKKIKKARGTFLEGIRREVCDGRGHVNFNLHLVRSFRSSSDTFNYQNLPIRDEGQADLIRRCFIAKDGYHLAENDFGAIEVRGIACYTQDPVLIDYVVNKDMHADQAMKIYELKREQVSKAIRHAAKNKFVFPTFYGSYYKDTARDLWETIDQLKIKLNDETPLRKHLRNKGWRKMGDCDHDADTKMGTFEWHVKRVEQQFWEQYHVSKEWREGWWADYLKRGYIQTLTGFVLSEPYKRNQIINLPVQGSMFHCLLQVLIWMNRWLRKKKMKSQIVGQIHDSIVSEVHPREKDDYFHQIKYFVETKLPKHWKWIIVPLLIEAEICPLGGNWHDKKGVEI